MLYITQLIYLKEGQESVFDEFERVAIPIIAKYNGRLLFRVRPPAAAYVEAHVEPPYEIHLVEFNDEQDFARFGADEERKRFLHLKEQSIRSTLLIRGTAL